MKRIKKTSFWGGDRYYCAHCGKRVGYYDKFCCICGMVVEWEHCLQCGYPSESMKDGFCVQCGTSLVRLKSRQ